MAWRHLIYISVRVHIIPCYTQMMVKRTLAQNLKTQEMTISPISVFIGNAFLQQTAAKCYSIYRLCIHINFIPEDVQLK